MKKLMTIIAILALLVSCSKKVSVEDCQFIEKSSNELFCYVNESLYDGEVVSNDGKSFTIDVKNGQVQSITIYHLNGKAALKGMFNSNDMTFFDRDGNEMDRVAFFEEYGKVLEDRITSQIKELEDRTKKDY